MGTRHSERVGAGAPDSNPVIGSACAWVLAVAVAAVASGCGRAPQDGLPHAIVLFTLDTARADHLSAYGYERATSPTLERIAEEGIRFSRAISPMPTTDPSHLSMMTGLYPRTHGVWRNGESLPEPDTPNLASWARELGYRTGAFVSRAHLRPSALGLRGFDHEDGPDAPSRPAAETAGRARDWVEEQGEEPFFLWLHFFDPHIPYAAPPPFRGRWQETDAPPGLERGKPWGYDKPHAPEVVRALVAAYDAEIAYADFELDRFLGWLERRLPSPPLLIVVGDHGEFLGELEPRILFAFGHGWYLYQGNLHVPFLIRWPGRLPAGRVVPGTAEIVDLAPTLFALLEAPGFPVQGNNLLPRIRGGGKNGKAQEYAFSQRRSSDKEHLSGKRMLAVQDDRYKLILSHPGGREELYDLASDPGETRDIAAERPGERARLRAELDAWLDRTPASASRSGRVPKEKVEALQALGYIE